MNKTIEQIADMVSELWSENTTIIGIDELYNRTPHDNKLDVKFANNIKHLVLFHLKTNNNEIFSIYSIPQPNDLLINAIYNILNEAISFKYPDTICMDICRDFVRIRSTIFDSDYVYLYSTKEFWKKEIAKSLDSIPKIIRNFKPFDEEDETFEDIEIATNYIKYCMKELEEVSDNG